MAGGLAKILTELLIEECSSTQITGVDCRSIPLHLNSENLEIKVMKYTRGNFEKLFREKKFDLVFHLGRLGHSHLFNKEELAQRLNLNVMGTQRILDLSLQFSVSKVVILSTFHVYGALHDNPVYLKEDTPLRAGITYPEIRDVSEMDQICSNWMWKNQGKIDCVIFRPCNIIGQQIHNTISQYLLTPFAPLPIDFNPMFQFIHERDMARVLLATLMKIPSGIYNVAPNETISLKETKKYLGVSTTPIPIYFFRKMASLLKHFWQFPDYLLEYIMYSCIIDPSLLNGILGNDFYKFTTHQGLDDLKKNLS